MNKLYKSTMNMIRSLQRDILNSTHDNK